MMKSDEVVFFLPPKTMNEATVYYVDIVKQGFLEAGYIINQTESLSDLKKYNKIFVMSAKWCFIVKLINPSAQIITWFQGLGGEEALMTKNSIIRQRLWNCVEFFSMKFSWLNIYVSERMHKYYQDTYRVKDKNFFIMPCFNKQLNLDSFNIMNKYNSPNFVYAGGLDAWQCIDETLELFSLLEKDLPNASLTLLTKDKVKAKEMMEKYNIENYTLNFVALENLDNELKKYKYGFLIRKDHIVNNVSTPTKMNSYLANGVIPVYTNVIDDFNDEISNLKYCIKLDCNDNVLKWKSNIVEYEKNSSSFFHEAEADIGVIFSKYYSKQHHISVLSSLLEKI